LDGSVYQTIHGIRLHFGGGTRARRRRARAGIDA
jgi:hypothetical protein